MVSLMARPSVLPTAASRWRRSSDKRMLISLDTGWAEILDMGTTGRVEKIADAEGGDLGVHLGVMDDLPNQEEARLGKDLSGGVGEIDRPLDSVAEAELLREEDGCPACDKDGSRGTDPLDQTAVVMMLDLLLDPLHHLRGPEVHLGCGYRHAVTEGQPP